MTPKQKDLVQQTFTLVKPTADETGKLFYNRLFEIAPELKHLFKDDITIQRMRFMNIFEIAIAYLDNVTSIAPLVQALAKRHVTYNVKAEYYQLMGEAFLWALEQSLGEAFTPEVKEAWDVVYTMLADTMKQVQ